MPDLASLGLRLEATQMVTGAGQADAALARVAQRGIQTSASMASLQRQVNQLGPAFAAFERAQSGLFVPAGLQAVVQTNQALATTAAVAPHVTRGLGGMRQGLLGLAAASIGVQGPLRSVISGLLVFGAGSGAALGIAAGIAAITKAWEFFTRATREAEKAQRELLKQAMETAAAIGITEVVRLGLARAAILQAIADKEKEIAKEAALTYRAVGAAEQLEREVLGLRVAEAQVMGQITALQGEIGEAARKAAEAEAKRLKDLRDEAAAPINRAATFRLNAAAELLALAEATTEEHERFLATIHAEAEAIRDAIDPSRELVRILSQMDDLVTLGQLTAAEAQARATQLLKDIGNAAAGTLDVMDELRRNAVENMQRDLADFFSTLVTDGISSFEELFSAVSRMWTQLLAEMAAKRAFDALLDDKGKLTGTGKNIASAGAGFGIGFSSENPIIGGLGGVGAAALLGAGPVGIALGAVGGFIGGILGAGEAARRAAEQIRQFKDELTRLELDVFGTPMEQAMERIRKQAEDLRKAAEATFPIGGGPTGVNQENLREREAAMARINALEAEQLRQLKAEAAFRATTAAKQKVQNELDRQLAAKRGLEDLEVRRLTALGQEEEANARAFQLAQQREYADALRAGADAATLAKLAEVQKAEAVRYALGVTEQEIATRQAALDGLRQTIESLKAFSIAIGGQISQPGANIAALRSQFETVAAQARLGDQAAAGRLPELGRALLEASRAYFASGPGFVQEAVRVQRMIDELAAQFADQASLEQEALDVAIAERDALLAILDALRGREPIEIDIDDRRRRWRDEDTSWRDTDRKSRDDQWRGTIEKFDELIETDQAAALDNQKQFGTVVARLESLEAKVGQSLTGLKVA
jgi:hypothetical protein